MVCPIINKSYTVRYLYIFLILQFFSLVQIVLRSALALESLQGIRDERIRRRNNLLLFLHANRRWYHWVWIDCRFQHMCSFRGLTMCYSWKSTRAPCWTSPGTTTRRSLPRPMPPGRSLFGPETTRTRSISTSYTLRFRKLGLDIHICCLQCYLAALGDL